MCSFDILPDGLGGPRSAFPHTITLVAGTQAANARQNSLALLKLSNLGQGKHGDKVITDGAQPYLPDDGSFSTASLKFFPFALCTVRICK